MTVREDVNDFLRALPRLRIALRQAHGNAQAAGFVTGGSRSYELVSLSVEALLADSRREGWELLDALVRQLGSNGLPPRCPLPVEDVLSRLVTHYEAAPVGPTTTQVEAGAARWARRVQLVLGEVRAPYPLLWPDGQPIACPVVEWRGTEVKACTGALWVHRDDATGVPALVACSHDKRGHTWPSGPAWLRLGALLGGVA